MPDVPHHRPMLKEAAAGRSGREGGSPGITLPGITVPGCVLHALPEGLLLLVLGNISREELGAAIERAGLDGCLLAPAGFEQWLIARDTPALPAALTSFGNALAGRAYVTDQSHGRIRMALSGPRSLDVFAKGCGIDFSAFRIGAGAMTLFGHVGCHLYRMEAETFHLTVLRSFALALWDELIEAGLEYGVEAIAP